MFYSPWLFTEGKKKSIGQAQFIYSGLFSSESPVLLCKGKGFLLYPVVSQGCLGGAQSTGQSTEPTLRIPEGFHDEATEGHEGQANQIEVYL